MAISSNQKRGAERLKCRRKLAEHIKAQLGLDVLPENVRLRPRRDDRYQWKVVGEPLRGLFTSKDLSNCTVGEFRGICSAIDASTIEAVLPQQNEEGFLCDGKYRSLVSHDSNSIERLERERQNDLREFEQYRETAQQKLQECQTKCQTLQEQVLRHQREIDLHQGRLRSTAQIISPILNSLTHHLSELLDLQHQS